MRENELSYTLVLQAEIPNKKGKKGHGVCLIFHMKLSHWGGS